MLAMSGVDIPDQSVTAAHAEPEQEYPKNRDTDSPATPGTVTPRVSS